MSRDIDRPADPSHLDSYGPAWLSFALLMALILAALLPGLAQAQKLNAARMWPSQEYTRITLEADQAVRYQLQTVRNPDRVVLDLEGVEPAGQLDALMSRVTPADPHVRAVRTGRFKPGVLRVVFDLKEEVRAEAFVLAPVGEYGHRLVLDLHSLRSADPMMALINREGAAAPSAATASPAPAGVEPAAEIVPVLAVPSMRSPSAPAPRRAQESDPGRVVTVAIDAGHGGEDPGAKGRLGTWEKDITLSIARKLKTMIDAEPGMRAVLTRDGDYFVPLAMRVTKARRASADLFVSIHADAFIRPNARGSSVFALSESGATSAAARWLAKKENEADLIGGVNLDVGDPYLKQTLLDLSQTATINDSLKLGRAVLGQIGGLNTLHKSHVEQAGFAVLKAPDIPSILVETAFITNPEEERKLRDDGYRDKMAAAILAGIKSYFASNPALARNPRVALNQAN